MISGKYREKAENIIKMSRDSGARANPAEMLDRETINLALMETFSRSGLDESQFDRTYNDEFPRSREKLVNVFISQLGTSSDGNLSISYQKVVDTLREDQSRGGRGMYEPRTVAGESIIIATALAIVANNTNLDLSQVHKYIKQNLEQVYENLMFALEIY